MKDQDNEMINALKSLIKDLRKGKITLRDWEVSTPVREIPSDYNLIEYEHTGDLYISLHFIKQDLAKIKKYKL
jgi:hypothetical protein